MRASLVEYFNDLLGERGDDPMIGEWTEFAASAFNARGLPDLDGVTAANEAERAIGG